MMIQLYLILISIPAILPRWIDPGILILLILDIRVMATALALTLYGPGRFLRVGYYISGSLVRESLNVTSSCWRDHVYQSLREVAIGLKISQIASPSILVRPKNFKTS